VAEIVSSPVLRREAAAVAAEVQRLAQPCGEEAVRLALQPLVLLYGVGQAGKAPAFWRIYAQQLAGFPADALRAAVEAYPGCEACDGFFPKPHVLKRMAEAHAQPIRRAANRCRLALRTEPPPRRPRMAPERVRALLADTCAAIDARAAGRRAGL
jgi:hypothetical protein